MVDPEERKARALDRVHRTAGQLEGAKEGFHLAIRRALATASVREVAEAAGLSPTHVHRIKNQERSMG